MVRLAVLDGIALVQFLRQLASIKSKSFELMFWIDDDGLKIKVDGGTWSPAMGKVVVRDR